MQIKRRQFDVLNREFGHRPHEKREIKPAFQQRRPEIQRDIDGEIDIHARILFAESLQKIRQPRLRNGLGRADPEQAFSLGRVRDALLDLFFDKQHLLCIGQKQAPLLGQDQISGSAFEQRRTKFGFEICDARGHRRLRQVQAFCRFTKAAEARNPEECADLIKGHSHS